MFALNLFYLPGNAIISNRKQKFFGSNGNIGVRLNTAPDFDGFKI
jgi:hypothetical protein